MQSERFQRVKDVFQTALAFQPDGRRAYLDGACEGDAELRAEVAALLTVDGESAGFLETPATTGLSPGWSDTSLAGIRLGDCRLSRVICSGGMGTVYEALQEHPRRTVAVKVMKRGVVSRSDLRRFEFEAQIMANLNHPNIAQVIESGTGEEGDVAGLPYLVMEYVPDALPITDYATRAGLGVKQRLDLFLQVCEAVHYGHGKGVIHRDLKPSNILVDDVGHVKVIDFGVARVTDSDVNRTTAHTEVGQLLGTLQYMSPEQCEADPNKLDIRSDVYALGVVLYELLCEALPYDVGGAAVLEAARLIREESPKRPSSRNRTLRGDVETIVLKALEKQRSRRYQTVSELRMDIQRHLRGEVISARPSGLWIRLVKLLRRHPVLGAAVGTTNLCLAAFLLYVVFWSYPRLQEERVKLEVEAGNTWMINDFLREMLAQGDPFTQGREMRVSELLDLAAERIEVEFPERPGIEASLRWTLGLTYLGNGRYEAAEQQLLASLALHRNLPGEDTADPADEANVLRLESDIAGLYILQGRLEEADELLLALLTRSARVFGPDHPQTLELRSQLARLYRSQGRYEESALAGELALSGLRRVLGGDHPETLACLGSLAQLYEETSRFDEADALHHEVVEAWRRTKGEDHPFTLGARTDSAELYLRQGHFAEAIPLFEEILEVGRRILGEEHPETLKMLGNLGLCYSGAGRHEEAEEILRLAVEKKRRLLGAEHRETLISVRNLADLLGNLGRFEESKVLYLEAIDGYRRVLGEDHLETINLVAGLALLYWNHGYTDESEPLFVESLAGKRRLFGDDHNETLTALNNLAGLYFRQGRYEEAEPLFVEALDGKLRLLDEDSLATLSIRNNLANLYMKLDRPAKAERMFRETLASLRRVMGDDHPNTLALLGNLATLLGQQGRLEESESLLLESVAGLRESLGDDHWLVLDTCTGLGKLYIAQGRLVEAEELLTDALQRKRDSLGDDNSKTLLTLQRLVTAIDNQGRHAEAEVLARELLERTAPDSKRYPERQELLEHVLQELGRE